jgi:hypothetical protein
LTRKVAQSARDNRPRALPCAHLLTVCETCTHNRSYPSQAKQPLDFGGEAAITVNQRGVTAKRNGEAAAAEGVRRERSDLEAKP